MAMMPNEIKNLIAQTLTDAFIHVQPLANDNDHYAIYVFSDSFEGKTRIQQHQIVYRALNGHAGQTIHALSIKTGLRQEAENFKKEFYNV